MRLLNVNTRRLESFADERSAPDYGILSHTWGEEEITFADIEQKDHAELRQKKGYRKIDFVCGRAREWVPANGEMEHIEYVWIDTCCIDKSSSAELSEAINSMFKWYGYSRVCWVYLEDFSKSIGDAATSRRQHFINCRWFTRGWTLQELLAPRHVVFYDRNGDLIGKCRQMIGVIAEATNIDRDVLRRETRPSETSVAKRMSWAANRQTTRSEDRAYSLLGIFNIAMPLLYGEGSKAFRRLQEEIMKVSVDHSLFAWYSPWYSGREEILAPTPSEFARSGAIRSFHRKEVPNPYRLTNRGLEINLPLMKADRHDNDDMMLAILDCGPEDGADLVCCLSLQPVEDTWSGLKPASLGCMSVPLDSNDSETRLLEYPTSMIPRSITYQNLVIGGVDDPDADPLFSVIFRCRGAWKLSISDPGPFPEDPQGNPQSCIWTCKRQFYFLPGTMQDARFVFHHQDGTILFLSLKLSFEDNKSDSGLTKLLTPKSLHVVIFEQDPLHHHGQDFRGDAPIHEITDDWHGPYHRKWVVSPKAKMACSLDADIHETGDDLVWKIVVGWSEEGCPAHARAAKRDAVTSWDKDCARERSADNQAGQGSQVPAARESLEREVRA